MISPQTNQNNRNPRGLSLKDLFDEKKITDKTVEEVEEEEMKIKRLENKIDLLIKEVTDIKNEVAKK